MRNFSALDYHMANVVVHDKALADNESKLALQDIWPWRSLAHGR